MKYAISPLIIDAAVESPIKVIPSDTGSFKAFPRPPLMSGFIGNVVKPPIYAPQYSESMRSLCMCRVTLACTGCRV